MPLLVLVAFSVGFVVALAPPALSTRARLCGIAALIFTGLLTGSGVVSAAGSSSGVADDLWIAAAITVGSMLVPVLLVVRRQVASQ
jgi:phage terminase large subunit-like protein